MQLKIAVVSEIPTPYRIPLFAQLGTRPDVQVMVFYCAGTDPWRGGGALEDQRFPSKVLPGFTFGGKAGGMNWKVNPGISRELTKYRPDVVVLGGYVQPTMLLAIAWCRRRSVPYILHWESHDAALRARWKMWVKRPLVRGVVRGASAFLATSSLAASHLKRWGAEERDIFLLPNLPDVAGIAAATASHRDHRSAPPTALRFIYVGRLVNQKGLHDLLTAFRDARTSHAAELHIYGEGTLESEIRARCRDEQIASVYLHGYLGQDRLPAVLAEADCLVLPSHDEPFGVVVMEALAGGVPVIISDRVGSGPDHVASPFNGFVFPAGDVLALRRMIEDLSARPDRLRAMKKNAEESVKRWTYDRGVSVFLEAVSSASGKRVGEVSDR